MENSLESLGQSEMMLSKLKLQRFSPIDSDDEIVELVTEDGRVICDVSIDPKHGATLTFGVGVGGISVSVADIRRLLDAS